MPRASPSRPTACSSCAPTGPRATTPWSPPGLLRAAVVRSVHAVTRAGSPPAAAGGGIIAHALPPTVLALHRTPLSRLDSSSQVGRENQELHTKGANVERIRLEGAGGRGDGRQRRHRARHGAGHGRGR